MTSTIVTPVGDASYKEAAIGLMYANPFFYGWLSQLTYTPTARVDVAAVSYDQIGGHGRILINEEAFSAYPLKERIFILQHELLHWVYEHPFYPEMHDPDCNVAMDMFINGLLGKAKTLAMPGDALTKEKVVAELRQLGIDPDPLPPDDSGSLVYYDWLKQQYAKQPTTPVTIKVVVLTPGSSGEEGEDEPSSEGDDDGEESQSQSITVRLGTDGDNGSAGEQDDGGEGDEQSGGSPAPSDQGDDPDRENGGARPDSESTEDEATRPTGEALRERLNVDLHDNWQPVNDPQVKEAAKAQLAQDMSEAKARLTNEEFQKACGQYASRIEEVIKSFKTREVRWQDKLRKFVGYCGAVILRSTYSQFNKYRQLPKIKLLPGTHLAVLLDTSGSMSSTELSSAFGELESLHKHGVTFDVIQYDWTVKEDRIKLFRKGQSYEVYGRGGTNFQAAFDWLKDNWQKRRYSGAVVITDGECTWPRPDTVVDARRVLWVITSKRYTAPAACGSTVHITIPTARSA